MNNQNMCPNCMGTLNGQEKSCPYCNFDLISYVHPQDAGKLFGALKGKYVIGRVMNRGRLGYYYIGWFAQQSIYVGIMEHPLPQLAYTMMGQTIGLFTVIDVVEEKGKCYVVISFANGNASYDSFANADMILTNIYNDNASKYQPQNMDQTRTIQNAQNMGHASQPQNMGHANQPQNMNHMNQPQNMASGNHAPRQTEKSDSSSQTMNILIIVIAILIAGIMIGATVWFISRDSSKKDDEENTTAASTTVETTTATEAAAEETAEAAAPAETAADTEATTVATTEATTTEEATEDYLIPGSDSRYITEEDIQGMDKDTLRIARNEIFARHGRMFDDQELQDYFNSKSWYQGTIKPDDFNMSTLNEYEKANIDFIKKYE